MSDPATATRKLPLRKILWSAFALPWRHRADFVGPLGLPLLAMIGCSLAWRRMAFQPPVAAWVAMVPVYCLAMSWLAITVHRLVLLEASDARTPWNAQSWRRLGLFTAAGAGLWLSYVVIGVLIASVVVGLISITHGDAEALLKGDPTKLPLAAIEWISYSSFVLTAWAIGRLCLVLPAIAVDDKPDVAALWRASRGNAWRLAVVAGVLPLGLELLMNLLEGHSPPALVSSVFAVITAPLVVVEVVALSLSYWELTSPAPPPTPEPS